MSVRLVPLCALCVAFLAAGARSQEVPDRKTSSEKKEAAAAPKETEEVKKARAKLDRRLEQLGAKGGQVVWVTDPRLAKLFPGETFFAVRFRQFPKAQPVPKHLQPSNVFAVSDDGVQRIRGVEDVGEFLAPKLRGNVTLERAGDVVYCAAALVREFVQDGFYEFKTDPRMLSLGKTRQSVLEVEHGGILVEVVGGGTGHIWVGFNFDGTPPLFEPKILVKPGPRTR